MNEDCPRPGDVFTLNGGCKPALLIACDGTRNRIGGVPCSNAYTLMSDSFVVCKMTIHGEYRNDLLTRT